MIKIEIRENTFSISGHAEYGEHGRDIVCASISAIAQTAFLGIQKYTYGFVDSEIRPGFMYVRVDTHSPKAMAILDAFKLGCESIASQYPQFVEVI
mgnify:CR=1 FL=1